MCGMLKAGGYIATLLAQGAARALKLALVVVVCVHACVLTQC
jgi:hypothetical protein